MRLSQTKTAAQGARPVKGIGWSRGSEGGAYMGRWSSSLATADATERPRKIKNNSCAIPADAPARPLKPRMAAINATDKKVKAQPIIEISVPLV